MISPLATCDAVSPRPVLTKGDELP